MLMPYFIILLTIDKVVWNFTQAFLTLHLFELPDEFQIEYLLNKHRVIELFHSRSSGVGILLAGVTLFILAY